MPESQAGPIRPFGDGLKILLQNPSRAGMVAKVCGMAGEPINVAPFFQKDGLGSDHPGSCVFFVRVRNVIDNIFHKLGPVILSE